jgi:hypothetical protein
MSLQHLYNLDKRSPQFSGQLEKFLFNKEFVEGFRKLPEGELVELANYLDSVSRLLYHG